MDLMQEERAGLIPGVMGGVKSDWKRDDSEKNDRALKRVDGNSPFDRSRETKTAVSRLSRIPRPSPSRAMVLPPPGHRGAPRIAEAYAPRRLMGAKICRPRGRASIVLRQQSEATALRLIR